MDFSDPKHNVNEDGGQPYLVADVVKDVNTLLRTTADSTSIYFQAGIIFPFAGALPLLPFLVFQPHLLHHAFCILYDLHVQCSACVSLKATLKPGRAQMRLRG